MFDFEHDGAEDIVSLTGDGYQVEAFGRATSTSVAPMCCPSSGRAPQLRPHAPHRCRVEPHLRQELHPRRQGRCLSYD